MSNAPLLGGDWVWVYMDVHSGLKGPGTRRSGGIGGPPPSPRADGALAAPGEGGVRLAGAWRGGMGQMRQVGRRCPVLSNAGSVDGGSSAA